MDLGEADPKDLYYSGQVMQGQIRASRNGQRAMSFRVDYLGFQRGQSVDNWGNQLQDGPPSDVSWIRRFMRSKSMTPNSFFRLFSDWS